MPARLHLVLCAIALALPSAASWLSGSLPRAHAVPLVSYRAPHLSLVESDSETARAQVQAKVAKAFQEANAEVLSAAQRAEALAEQLDDPAEAAAAIDSAGSQRVIDLARSWVARPLRRCKPLPHWLEELAEVVEGGTVPGLLLVAATFISLSLANLPATSAPWLAFWSQTVGPNIGSHALSIRGWINEGLMAIFFFVVGLEIKQEFRLGSLASVRKAVLPCLAALGGMVTPMAVYLACQAAAPGGGSLLALTVPMATDIAFAMGILGFFRAAMPLSASAFLLTLATVDDLGAILVLATCFASHVVPGFLAAAAAIFVSLGIVGRAGSSDLRLFGAGGAGVWYCLLRAGVNSDVAGVLAAMCISTRAMVKLPSGKPERLTERAIRRLSPFTALGVMPLFALANTAVRLGGPVAATGLSASAAAAAAAAAATASAASVTPAVGIAAGLVIGKPLGIFGFTWLANKFGVAKLPSGMNLKHLGVVGMLGGIGFTMCLLLCEVALPTAMQTIPKLSVLAASAFAASVSALVMASLPPVPLEGKASAED